MNQFFIIKTSKLYKKKFEFKLDFHIACKQNSAHVHLFVSLVTFFEVLQKWLYFTIFYKPICDMLTCLWHQSLFLTVEHFFLFIKNVIYFFFIEVFLVEMENVFFNIYFQMDFSLTWEHI